MKNTIILLLLNFAIILGIWVHEAQALTLEDSPALQKLSKDLGADIRYIGTRYGIALWGIVRDGGMQVIFTDPTGKAVIMDGLLFGPDGRLAGADLVQQFASEHPALRDTVAALREEMTASQNDTKADDKIVPKPIIPDPVQVTEPELTPEAEALWQRLSEDVTSFTADNTTDAPVVHLVMDADCMACHKLWTRLAPYVAKGEVNANIVPVALQGADSLKAWIQVLAADQPMTTWQSLTARVQQGEALSTISDDFPAELPTSQRVSMAKAHKAVLDNTRHAVEMGFVGTPYLIYRDQSMGNAIKTIVGDSEDVNALLISLTASQTR